MRTFLAIDLDDSILDALGDVRMQLDDETAKIRWVAPANQHVTMQFLGDVEDNILADVCKAIAYAASEIEPFKFDVQGIQCIPPEGRQLRFVWAGVVDCDDGLARLYQALEESVAELGFPPERRPFKPHLTLARIKYAPDPEAIRQAAEGLADAYFGTQHAAELVAYTSILTPDGPVYTALSRSRLGR